MNAIFGVSGILSSVPEKKLDAVPAVSGSGPAYGYMFIEALADAGIFIHI